MATFTSTTKPTQASTGDGGNLAVHSDSITPTAGALNDVYRFGPFPGGIKPFMVKFKNADLDSNATPLIAAKVGYSFANGDAAPSGADTAFAAAGQTFLQAASAAGGNNFLVKPFEIKQDYFIDVVLTAAAATFASGEVTCIVLGEAVGVK